MTWRGTSSRSRPLGNQTVPVMSQETNAAGWRGDYLALHALIRRRRKALRLTQAEAGAAIGLSERSYRDIEAGRRDIGAEALFRLCATLNIRLVPAENRQDLAGFEGL